MATDLTLKLGDFVFQGAEIPEKIQFGGDQKLAVHKLVGGGRVIDAMGRDDAPLEWSGMFLGPDAVRRARYLDGLRIAGAPLKLTWHHFAYDVVIRTFHAPFERFYKIPYSIVCEVVQDKSTPITSLPTPGVINLIQADLNAANTFVAQVGDAPLTQSVGQFSTAVAAIPPGTKITPTMQNRLLALLNTAQQRTSDLIDATNTVLKNGAAAVNSAALAVQVSSTQFMNNLMAVRSLLGRISNNLGVVVSGSITVTVSGGTNLYDLAAKQYGDPTKWTSIANANGLTDPFLPSAPTTVDNTQAGGGVQSLPTASVSVTGVVTLTIPALPDSTGGVLQT